MPGRHKTAGSSVWDQRATADQELPLPANLETLDFTGVFQLPSAFAEGLVYAAGSLWTTDVDEVFRVAPDG